MTERYQKLKDIPFPDCYSKCAVGQYFGVCECEGCCPNKFDQDGNPIDPNQKIHEDSQARL